MNLLKILNTHTTYYHRVMKLNKKTDRCSLILTPKDVERILEERENTLMENRIVDLDIQVTEDIIKHLRTSSFVDQDNFVETILGIQEVFYYVKGETDILVSDERLLDILFEYYDDRGSIELLSGRDMDELIRQMNL